MSTAEQLENRIATLERIVDDLRAKIDIPRIDPDWISKLTGSMEGAEGFEDMIEYGRQFRKTGCLPDETCTKEYEG